MKKRIKIIFLLLIILIGAAVLTSAVFAFYIAKDLPPVELIENHQVAESTKIYDRTGKILLYEIHGEERRVVIPFREIPEIVKQATIAIEDINFYSHFAFDLKAIARAVIANLVSAQVVQGGSTITQQLVKNAFLTSERTLKRKIKELVLSIQLERRLTKDEILELYLNQIPYGFNAYGIEAAAQIFFEKSANELTVAEAALLASLPKAPTYFSPWGQNKDALFARQKTVLERMQQAGFISAEEKNKALAEKLKFAKPASGIKAPHFVIMVQDYLNRQYGEDFVKKNGLKVITSLDWELQQLGEEVVARGAERNTELYQGKNAALVAQDPKTGQLLALVGSKDYFDVENEGNFNVAVQGLRQPGSAFKPFVYVTAFKKGFTPDTIVFDLETEFDTTGNPEKSYKPENFTEKFLGPLTFRQALAQSVNVAAVKVLYLTGAEEALTTAGNLGITTLGERDRYGLTLVLGGGEVTLAEMVGAYSVFAREGIKHRQSFILEVSTKSTVLEKYEDISQRVIDPQYARIMNDVLSDQKSRAPLFGSSLVLHNFPEHQLAVKTGTTNDYRDAWSIGYTPSLAVGVWAGNNDNSPMIKKGSSIFAAVPMWKEFMDQALRKYPAEVFNKPEEIFAEKPVMKGEYLVNYKSGDKLYPQIHNILFYLDKNNPSGPAPENPESASQFKNWEEPVIRWARANIQNFHEFNKPIPLGSLVAGSNIISPKTNKAAVSIIKPKNGEFISNLLAIEAKIDSNIPLTAVNLYLNGKLISSKAGALGKQINYTNSLKLENVELQNLVELVVVDEKNNKTQEKIILFSPLKSTR